MRRVAEAVQQADRDGLDAIGDQGAQDFFDFRIVGGPHHLAGGVDPLVDFAAQGTRHHRIGTGRQQVVQVKAQLTGDFDDVPKARRGDQAGLGTLALNDQVGHRRRGADHHVGNLVDRDAVRREHGLKPRADGRNDIAHACEHLGREHAPVAADQHKVGKRPADVECESIGRCRGMAGHGVSPSPSTV